MVKIKLKNYIQYVKGKCYVVVKAKHYIFNWYYFIISDFFCIAKFTISKENFIL